MLKKGSIALMIAVLVIAGGCGRKKIGNYTIEQFKSNVRIIGGSFSPDETSLLITGNQTGIFNAYRIPVKGGRMEPLTASSGHSIFALTYFPDDERFLYLADTDGNELYHIFMQDKGGNVTDLTPDPRERAVFLGWTHDLDHFVYSSNRRDQKFMDIYLMDIRTMTPKMIYLNESGYNFGWISNDMRYMSFSRVHTTHDSDLYIYDRQTGEMKHITPHKPDVNYTPLDFSPDSKSMFYLTDEDSEFRYVKEYSIDDGTSGTVETADWDIVYSQLSWNGTYRVTGINNQGRTEMRVTLTETGEPVELQELPEGVITAVDFSRSERYMRFYLSSSKSPNNLYVHDFKTGATLRLTDTMNPEIDPDDLVNAQTVSFKSFDGEVIPAVLYKPQGIRPGEKVPAMIYVHGGPGGQATLEYSDIMQYLANHRYAILAVNYRGSSGYGKRYLSLDDLKHGSDDLKDCIEAKKWLQQTGFVDPERIGIFGASYGGFMVLAALAFHPDEFRVGIDFFGISNWPRTLSDIPSWWESYRTALYREMGDPVKDAEYLKSISPLFYADRITRPLMIVQGGNDPRVPRGESEDMVDALRKNGVKVKYLVFEDEGHGFLKTENMIKGYKAMLDFLDRHLKDGK